MNADSQLLKEQRIVMIECIVPNRTFLPPFWIIGNIRSEECIELEGREKGWETSCFRGFSYIHYNHELSDLHWVLCLVLLAWHKQRHIWEMRIQVEMRPVGQTVGYCINYWLTWVCGLECYKKAKRSKPVSSVLHCLYFSSCLQAPTFSSCDELLWWWTVMKTCKLK